MPEAASSTLARALWPESDLTALLEALARKAGLDSRAVESSGAAGVESLCSAMGLETEATDVWGFRIEQILRAAAPALVPVSGKQYLGLVEIQGRRAILLAPDLSLVHIPLADLARAMCDEHGRPFRDDVNRVLDECGVNSRRRERALDAMIRERLRYTLIATVWPLRTPPGASFWRQLAGAGMVRRGVLLAAAHFGEYLLWIFAWFLLGRDALQGRLDAGWLAAWALALAAIVPCRLFTTWLQGSIAIAGGGLLRQRLLDGALRLTTDEVRHEGAGRFLARAIETETIESLALSGGLLSALALLELAIAGAVLLMGAAGPLHVALLAVWTGGTLALAWRYYKLRSEWTSARLSMTHDLVERMTGHRTRLAQEAAADWHASEDQAMQHYLVRSAAMDRAGARLTGLAPRAWLIAGIAALGPVFLGAQPSAAAMAISLGGLLLAWQALRKLTGGLANLGGAAISWRQVAPLFEASARGRNERGQAGSAAEGAGEIVLDARDVAFQYPDRAARVLDGVDLQVRRGDWILLEGESGGGKSTLVSVLTGLRAPSSGLLLTGGLDRQTLGTRAWRRRIAAAPQYQENHVLTGPLAFNLLMGRRWPAANAAIQEAEQVCRELGLGPLLDRMPGGMMQMVGETGWQLSQGERSRLFMARALLQNSEMVVLDESFGALDPETLRQSLECVLKRAKTLLVVAHP